MFVCLYERGKQKWLNFHWNKIGNFIWSVRAVDQLSIEEVSRWSHIDVPVNRQYVSAILFAHKPSGGTAAERIYYIRLWLSSRRSERERGLSVARALLFVPLSFPSRLYQWVLAIGPKQLLRNRPSGTQEIANKSKRNAPENKERERKKNSIFAPLCPECAVTRAWRRTNRCNWTAASNRSQFAAIITGWTPLLTKRMDLFEFVGLGLEKGDQMFCAFVTMFARPTINMKLNHSNINSCKVI